MAPSKPRANADDAHGAAGHGHNGGAGTAGTGAASLTSTAAAAATNGGSGTHNHSHLPAPNGKARRAAAASNASASAATAAAAAAAHQLQQQPTHQPQQHLAASHAHAPPTNPTLQWVEFERGVLHGYTRAFNLDEPGAFANDFSRWILTQPGSVGLQSPTMLRRKELRRQSKTRLANAVRKHFNGQGGQENDIVVDFLHKVQTHEVARHRRPRRMGSNAREIDG